MHIQILCIQRCYALYIFSNHSALNLSAPSLPLPLPQSPFLALFITYARITTAIRFCKIDFIVLWLNFRTYRCSTEIRIWIAIFAIWAHSVGPRTTTRMSECGRQKGRNGKKITLLKWHEKFSSGDFKIYFVNSAWNCEQTCTWVSFIEKSVCILCFTLFQILLSHPTLLLYDVNGLIKWVNLSVFRFDMEQV